jgi:hypothetical protein
MNTIITTTCIAIACILANRSNGQVGIGTISPDSSSILDLYSTSKGFLLPRMTTANRELIIAPANGLMIYNTVVNEIQVNIGSSTIPQWTALEKSETNTIFSITATGDLTTSSNVFEPISDMTLSPAAGTYLVFFNGQFGLSESVPISTMQAAIDLQNLYDQLMAVPVTNSMHAAVFGNGETITPGIYNVAGAGSMAGILTLDGEGDTNSIFVIRLGGAFAVGAGSTVMLTNGARPVNIYWVAEGASSIAANSIMKGTFISHAGAAAVAAGSDLVGRVFTLSGAITFGPGTAIIPSGSSSFDMGVLSSFVLFTSLGAVNNTEPSTITGDVGSNGGAITGFENLNGNTYGSGSAPPPINNTLVTFSIFQNGELIPYSSRTIDVNTAFISLQAMATISTGQTIDVRWHVDEGPVWVGNRILSLVRS